MDRSCLVHRCPGQPAWSTEYLNPHVQYFQWIKTELYLKTFNSLWMRKGSKQVKLMEQVDGGAGNPHYGFPVMYRCEIWTIKNGWALKNCCVRTVGLEKTRRRIKPVNPKGNQSWIFTRRIDGEAKTPILWSSDGKSQLAGKDLGQEKGITEDRMVR